MSQGRRGDRRGQFFKKNRKGVSIMVGYVLLVVFAVVLSVIVYQWIKTYVPGESLQCIDGVSVFLKTTDYNCSTNQLNLTIKNNGRFSVLGYFIHAANDSAQEIATIDLSQYINDSFAGQKFGSSIAFISTQDNSFSPGDEKKAVFSLPIEINEVKLLQIIPTRFQEIDNKKRFISCGEAKIKETIVCGVTTSVPPACTPDTCSSLGYVCGVWDDGCTGTIDCNQPGCDPITEFCDAAGQCILNSCTPAADPCGTRECGSISNNTCGTGSCGTCTIPEETCDEGTGLCVSSSSCNGVWEGASENPGVECDGTPLPTNCLADCTCGGGYVPDGSGGCVLPSSVNSCPAYCDFLSYGGIPPGSCTNSEGNCVSGGGVYESIGDQWCTGGSQADTCCCNP